MSVPNESEKPPSETIKVVFGWRAWLLFALILGVVGSSAPESSTLSSEIQQLRREVNRLQSEVQQLRSETDRLSEDAAPE